MKPSKYNYILSDGLHSYWFNGVSKSFFRLSLALGEKLKTALSAPSEIEAEIPSLYTKLVDGGFLLEDDVDELETIRKRNEERIHSKDYFMVVLPTLNCNFKCWYCIQDHVPSSMSDETIQRVKSHIDYMVDVKKITSLRLEWFGGEPFMYFRKVIVPIAEYAIKKCEEADIPFASSATTNAYFINEEVSKELTRLKFNHFQITLDGEKEFHDKVKFQNSCASAFEHVLRNINNFLTENSDINVSLRINYTHKTLSEKIVDEVNAFISEDNRARVMISPHKVWQEDVDKNFPEILHSILDKFVESGYNVQRWNPSTDFVSCYANREYYNAINYNGNVVKCTACNDLYSSDPVGTLMNDGSISWIDDFDKKYQSRTFENKRCLNCHLLPTCMGVCPRDHVNGQNYCKFDVIDETFENSIVQFIKNEYGT